MSKDDPRLAWLMDQLENADRSGCWEYPFDVHDKYGRVRWRGKVWRVHRVAWQIEQGRDLPTARNMVVMHDCDNMRCCNPDHLTLGRQQQNTRDAWKRGLAKPRRGTKGAAAKLTEDQVRQIRRYGPPVTQYDLAEEFGVSQTTICHIRQRRVYADVPD